MSENTLLVKDKPTKKFYINVDTIKGYLREVNKHYIDNNKSAPYNTCIKTQSVRSLGEQERFYVKCACWAPLVDEVHDPHEFQSHMWHITNVGRQGEVHCQEYAIESHDKITN